MGNPESKSDRKASYSYNFNSNNNATTNVSILSVPKDSYRRYTNYKMGDYKTQNHPKNTSIDSNNSQNTNTKSLFKGKITTSKVNTLLKTNSISLANAIVGKVIHDKYNNKTNLNMMLPFNIAITEAFDGDLLNEVEETTKTLNSFIELTEKKKNVKVHKFYMYDDSDTEEMFDELIPELEKQQEKQPIKVSENIDEEKKIYIKNRISNKGPNVVRSKKQSLVESKESEASNGRGDVQSSQINVSTNFSVGSMADNNSIHNYTVKTDTNPAFANSLPNSTTNKKSGGIKDSNSIGSLKVLKFNKKELTERSNSKNKKEIKISKSPVRKSRDNSPSTNKTLISTKPSQVNKSPSRSPTPSRNKSPLNKSNTVSNVNKSKITKNTNSSSNKIVKIDLRKKVTNSKGSLNSLNSMNSYNSERIRKTNSPEPGKETIYNNTNNYSTVSSSNNSNTIYKKKINPGSTKSKLFNNSKNPSLGTVNVDSIYNYNSYNSTVRSNRSNPGTVDNNSSRMNNPVSPGRGGSYVEILKQKKTITERTNKSPISRKLTVNKNDLKQEGSNRQLTATKSSDNIFDMRKTAEKKVIVPSSANPQLNLNLSSDEITQKPTKKIADKIIFKLDLTKDEDEDIDMGRVTSINNDFKDKNKGKELTNQSLSSTLAKEKASKAEDNIATNTKKKNLDKLNKLKSLKSYFEKNKIKAEEENTVEKMLNQGNMESKYNTKNDRYDFNAYNSCKENKQYQKHKNNLDEDMVTLDVIGEKASNEYEEGDYNRFSFDRRQTPKFDVLNKNSKVNSVDKSDCFMNNEAARFSFNASNKKVNNNN